MAERRMFAKTIIDSDAFLDMPLSTQALYFHLNMRADDDGFINNAKKIQRMIGASDDDLKVLMSKNFIIPFETGIVVIKHWKIHNYIRNDRYKATVYQEEKSMLQEKENKAYTLGIPNGYQMETQVRLGKDSIGKDSIDDAEIIKCYEENIGLITPATAELLLSYLDIMDKDLIIKAIKIATINNKRSGRYIQGILNDWNRKGLKTLLDIENEEQHYNNKNNKTAEEEFLNE